MRFPEIELGRSILFYTTPNLCCADSTMKWLKVNKYPLRNQFAYDPKVWYHLILSTPPRSADRLLPETRVILIPLLWCSNFPNKWVARWRHILLVVAGFTFGILDHHHQWRNKRYTPHIPVLQRGPPKFRSHGLPLPLWSYFGFQVVPEPQHPAARSSHFWTIKTQKPYSGLIAHL